MLRQIIYPVHLLCYCSLGDKLHEGRELAICFTPKIATVMVSNSIILLVLKLYKRKHGGVHLPVSSFVNYVVQIFSFLTDFWGPFVSY